MVDASIRCGSYLSLHLGVRTMRKTTSFVIGKVYIGSTEPFEVVTVRAYNVREALNIAANYLRPHHLQTLILC